MATGGNTDRRGAYVVITKRGRIEIEAAAPGHVAAVRRLATSHDHTRPGGNGREAGGGTARGPVSSALGAGAHAGGDKRCSLWSANRGLSNPAAMRHR